MVNSKKNIPKKKSSKVINKKIRLDHIKSALDKSKLNQNFIK